MKTKAQLIAELEANITDNTNHENTAARVREILADIINSNSNTLDNKADIVLYDGTVNMNSISDQTVTLGDGTLFLISDWLLIDPSIEMDTASVAQLNTDVNQGGLSIFGHSNGTGIEGLRCLNPVYNPSLAVFSMNGYYTYGIAKASGSILLFPPRYTCGNTLYFSLFTPQGSAATARLIVIGRAIS